MRRFFFCTIVLLALAPAAHADDDIETARAHYATGRIDFDRGDYRSALGEFRAAERFSTRPELDFNIARCYDEMGDAARAIAKYERYLAASPRAGDREAVGLAIERLKRRVGHLAIIVRAEGAQVILDGEPVTASDRAQPIAVTEGPHVVRASAEGCLPREVGVQVTAGETATASLDLMPIAVVEPGRTRRVGLFVGVGAAIVAVAAAIVIVAVAVRPGTDYWTNASDACVAPCYRRDLR